MMIHYLKKCIIFKLKWCIQNKFQIKFYYWDVKATDLYIPILTVNRQNSDCKCK